MSDQSNFSKLETEPEKFIADVMLGSLANQLILAGFDCSYDRSIEDSKLLKLAMKENRALLTRDQELAGQAENKVQCVLIRSDDIQKQFMRVLDTFDLSISRDRMFGRCPNCNVTLERVPLESVRDRVPDETKRWIDDYYQCPTCEKVYWRGSHYEDVVRKFKNWGALKDD